MPDIRQEFVEIKLRQLEPYSGVASALGTGRRNAEVTLNISSVPKFALTTTMTLLVKIIKS